MAFYYFDAKRCRAEEIINIVKSEEFQQRNLDGDSWEYVEKSLKKEYSDQLDILKRISTTNFSKHFFNELINQYEIEFS